MSDETPSSSPPPAAGAADVAEWRPDRRAAVLLNLVAVPLLLVGLVGYGALALLHAPRSGRADAAGLLLFLALTVLLTGALFAAHEGLHGAAMRAFGARPRFGALMIAGIAPAFYTTAPGHVFSRSQYLAVTLTPAVTISLLGALACLAPVSLVLVVPLAIHLSGCVGDLWATARLLREPPGTRCEDLRDSIRFLRPAGSAGARSS